MPLNVLFVNMFSYSKGCPFIDFLCCTKFLILIKFHLFIFTFIAFASGNSSKKNIATIYVKECSMFSSRSFMVSDLTFRSFIHLRFLLFIV